MTAQRCTKNRNSVLASHRIRWIARQVAAGLVVTACCLLPTALGFPPAAYAQELRLAPASPGPDARYKADILLVVAHPDDETMVTAYLAQAALDEHKRVAVIYGTRGDGGGNAEGYAEAAALGAEREIEGRRALGTFRRVRRAVGVLPRILARPQPRPPVEPIAAAGSRDRLWDGLAHTSARSQ